MRKAAYLCFATLLVAGIVLSGCHRPGAGISAVRTLHDEAGVGLLDTDLTSTGVGSLKIRLPKGWRVVEGMPGNIAFMAMSEQSATADGTRLVAMVQVMMLPSSSGDYDAQVSVARSVFKMLGGGRAPVEDQEVVVNGRRAHVLGGTMDMGAGSLRRRELSLVDGGHAYTVAFMAAPESWPKLNAAINASLLSVTF